MIAGAELSSDEETRTPESIGSWITAQGTLGTEILATFRAIDNQFLNLRLFVNRASSQPNCNLLIPNYAMHAC